MSARRGRPNAARGARRMRVSGDTALQRLLMLLPQALVLILAMLGFALSLLQSYALAVQAARVVGATLAFTALAVAIFCSRRYRLMLLICLLPAAFWIWRNADTLAQGLLLLIDQALDPLLLQLPDGMQALLELHDAEQTITLTTTALCALLFPITLLAGYFVMQSGSVFGLVLTTLPLLLPPFFYALSPETVPFFCLIAAYLMLYIGNVGKYMPATVARDGRKPAIVCRKEELSGQHPAQRLLSLGALPVIALTALLAGRMLPSDGYVRPEPVEALQERILSWDVGSIGTRKSNDGLTRGNLHSLSDIRFTGKPVLRVRVSEERALYLRDFSGTRFEERGWESASETDYGRYAAAFAELAPQNLHAAAAAAGTAGTTPYTLSVQNVAAAPASIWTPNGLVTTAEEIDGAVYVQDGALGVSGAGRLDAYTLEALACSAVLSPIPLASGTNGLQDAYLAAVNDAVRHSGSTDPNVQRVAQAYVDYVFAAYTELPAETREAAERLCAAYGLSLHQEDGVFQPFETCRDLYDLLTGRCAYAYSPPSIPEGVDFATYFLEESRRGYCVHFATAAAVLLRSLGIPARYAEGYIIVRSDYDKQPDEAGFIEIEDTHAHAWVEVFDPAQLEWIPVEMTASAGSAGDGAPLPESGLGETAPPASASPEATATPSAVPTPDAVTPSSEPSGGLEDAGGPETIPPENSPTPEPDDGTDGDASPEPEDGAAPEQDESASPEPENGEAPPPDIDITPPPADIGVPPEGPVAPERPPLWPFAALAIVAGLLLLALLWRWLLCRRYRRRFWQRDTNAAALAVCRHVVDMLRFAGCEAIQPLQMPQAYAEDVAKRLPWLNAARLAWLMELAQRARFSGRACGKQERDEAIAILRALAGELRAKLPRARGLLFRLRFPLI